MRIDIKYKKIWNKINNVKSFQSFIIAYHNFTIFLFFNLVKNVQCISDPSWIKLAYKLFILTHLRNIWWIMNEDKA